MADQQMRSKAKALAREFVGHNPWALSQGEEFDLDDLCGEVVNFVRSRGYELLDEPPCEYTPTPEKWVKTWGPEEE